MEFESIARRFYEMHRDHVLAHLPPGVPASLPVWENAHPAIRERHLQVMKSFLDSFLEAMVDEPAVTRAESTRQAIQKAADDPWNDTGYHEPMAEALCAAFQTAIDTYEE